MLNFFKKKKKKKLIIGIHGLGNKPPENLLYEWWLASINEGLSKINKNKIEADFRLVYWADVLHPKPLDPEEIDESSEYFLEEKYIPESGNKNIEKSSFGKNMVQYIKDQLNEIMFNEKLHINYPQITDFVIKHFFKELAVYFTKNCSGEGMENCLVREVIQEKLTRTLENNRDKDILLIAHSMGTIVAYDVLQNIEDENISVSVLVTCASPLGVPFIYNKIKHERGLKDKAVTPEAIRSKWFNLADLNDKIAVNYELDELFLPNKFGVRPEPIAVLNNYEYDGIKNPHKSYGYLRTIEMAEIISDFLKPEEGRALKYYLEMLRRKFNIKRGTN